MHRRTGIILPVIGAYFSGASLYVCMKDADGYVDFRVSTIRRALELWRWYRGLGYR